MSTRVVGRANEEIRVELETVSAGSTFVVDRVLVDYCHVCENSRKVVSRWNS